MSTFAAVLLACMCVCVHVCVCVPACVCLHVCMHVSFSASTCMFFVVFVCMCVAEGVRRGWGSYVVSDYNCLHRPVFLDHKL